MSKKKVKKLNHTTVWIDECTNITDDQWNYLSQKSIQSIDNARLLHLIKMSNPKGESVLFRMYNEHHSPESLNKFECGCDVGFGSDETTEVAAVRIGDKIHLIDNAIEVEKIKQELRGKSLLNTIDQMVEFTKTLNELKNKKPMEITEETRIKDLIPEGYEFNWNRALWLEEEECISIPIREKKKEEVKDFDWYMKQYRLKSYRHIDKNNFLKASFESKIGLLKFICDDLNIPVDIYFAISYVDRHGWEHEIKCLKDICPPEFLTSIFK